MEFLSITVPNFALYTASPVLLLGIVLVVTRLVTTWNYYASIRGFQDGPHGGTKIVRPPQIPYSIPWLGNTLSFLTRTPGGFWTQLFSWHPRSTGVCTLLIGGRYTHIVYSPATVQALFKARSPSRDVFEHDLYQQVFEMPMDQVHNAANGKHFEDEMFAKYLTNFSRVNELTAHYTGVLEKTLDRDAQEIVTLDEVGLYHWLRNRMFNASCTALMGDKVLEMCSDTFCEDFFRFESDFLQFFFRFPKAMMKEAHARRKKIFDNLEAWSREMHRLSGGTPVDPDGPAWEPYLGNRLNRARQLDYKNRNLTTRSGAALDAGIIFALATNVIPATGWMLFHILDPNSSPTLLPRVLAEVKQAEKPDGSLDIALLMSQPLLQSLWAETLRLYTDVLVARNLPEDLVLPLDEDGKRHVAFQKGDNIFAPSWLGHQDAAVWNSSHSATTSFDPERFLKTDTKTGDAVFSMGRSAGKFLPFGGGRTICPGRVFAKQEALGSVAMVLLRFEFEFKGFVDVEKKSTQNFPGFQKAFPGSGALAPGGDMRVKIKRRV